MAKARKKNSSTPVDQGHRLEKPVPHRRLWFYRLALMVVSPLFFFGAVEGVLRVIDFGYPTGFFLHQNISGQKRVIENSKFGWQFFGPTLARTPYPLNFPEEKPQGTIRIFVLGESAAYGDPQPDFGLPRMLEVLLRERYPGVRFEVVNAAMVAINSHVILPIARDCAREHGDIWLVYMGNNEVVGPFGSGTVFGAQAPPMPLVRASLVLKSTRMGELLFALLARAKGGAADSAEWRGLMMFMRHQVRQDDPRMARTYSHFKQNLTDILRAGTNSGAKVIVSTVASNLRNCAPFGSEHSPALTIAQSNEWNRLYQLGVKAEGKKDPATATNYYAQAANLDDHFANLQFRWAQMCLALGDENTAREHFILARDFDTLRFRADSQINKIIRDTAANHKDQGIVFVDAAAELARQSPDGICGETIFYEHVHFTFEGNYTLAKIFADQIAEALPVAVKRRADSQRTWLSADECARRLGWNDWSKRHALESLQINVPPFNLQLNHLEMIQHVHHQMDQLATAVTQPALQTAADQYRRLISATPDDWVLEKRLAEVLQELDDLNGAAESWRLVQKSVPQDAQAPLQLNLILLEQGKLEEAADEYAKALKLDRNFTEGAYAKFLCNTGSKVLQSAGADAAVPFFRQATSLRPYLAEAHIALGSALSAMGKTSEAQQEFRNAIHYPPTTPLGLESLAEACYQEGWTNEAIRNFEAALELDPTDSTAHFHLGVLFFKQQKNAAALNEFKETLRFDPENKEASAYVDQFPKSHTDEP